MANIRKRGAAEKPKGRELPEDLRAAVAEFDKAHGEGVIQQPGSKRRFNVIPTGIFILDFALCGGWTQGFASTAYGYHSTAKSTIFLNGVASFQRKHPDAYVVWCDPEGLYDAVWAEQIGCDLDRLIVSQPDYGELSVDIIEDMIQRPSVGLIVLDSIPACAPMKVLENSAEDDTMAALPRLMGKLCSKITTRVNQERRKKHEVTIWLINQLRDKVGFNMGSPRSLPGGRQINHVPTTKVWLKLIKEHEAKNRFGKDVPDFNEQGFKIEKRKHGSSINEGNFDLNRNNDCAECAPGMVKNVDTMVAFAKSMGFIGGGGGNFTLLTEKLGKIKNERTGEVRHKAHTKFRTLNDIKDMLMQSQEERDTLARSLIVEQRVSAGLDPLPPDGYLVSDVGRLVRIED